MAFACAVAAFLFGLKLAFGLALGSLAILSEAINSLVDLMASLTVLFLLRKASVPADSGHPFGHGKMETLAGLTQSSLIILMGLWVFVSALLRIFHPQPVKLAGWGIVLMAFCMVVTFFAWRILHSAGKKAESVALEASSVQFSMDLFTNLAVLIALAVISATGISLVDPLTAILVLAVVLFLTRSVFLRSLGDLLDESLPPSTRKEINGIIEQTLTSHYPKLRGFHKLRTRRSGLRKLVDLHLLGCKKLELHEAHQLAHSMEGNLRRRFPEMDVLIHSEPCEDDCETCDKLKREE
jgi:cation diffusion facilitator family transporter